MPLSVFVRTRHFWKYCKDIANLLNVSLIWFMVLSKIYNHFFMKCTQVLLLTNRDLTYATRVHLFKFPVTVPSFSASVAFWMFSNLFSIFFCIFSFFCGKALSYYTLADSDNTILQNLPILNIFAKCMLYTYLLQSSG